MKKLKLENFTFASNFSRAFGLSKAISSNYRIGSSISGLHFFDGDLVTSIWTSVLVNSDTSIFSQRFSIFQTINFWVKTMFWIKFLYNDNCMPFLCTIWYSQFDSWVRISMNMYHQRSSWFKNQIRFTKFYQVYWSLRILPSLFLSRWDYDIKVSLNFIKCSRWLISELILFWCAIRYIIHIISFQWTVDAVIMVIQVSAETTRIGTFFSTTRLSSYGMF